MRPVRVFQEGPAELRVTWDDGHAGRHTMATLRELCPCASCRSEQDDAAAPTLLPVLVPGRLQLTAIVPVGSYALQIAWGDGHRTGIYTYDYLRRLCECEACLASGRRSKEPSTMTP